MAHPPRIPVWLPWDKPVVYFVTFCVAQRKPVLADAKVFAAFRLAVCRLERWNVLAAVVMPDHLHVLAAPTQDREEAVGNLSGSLKRWTREPFRNQWEWQPGSFDRLLRSDESAAEKWKYIRENPVRAGLVDEWHAWPYLIGFEP